MEIFIFLILAILVGWTSAWVYRDSKHNQISTDGKPYTKGNGALAWLFACILLWIVVFPAYLYVRSKRLAARRPAGGSTSRRSVQPPVMAGDLDEQLRKLAKLKEEGILSEEEFNQKKRSLLGLLSCLLVSCLLLCSCGETGNSSRKLPTKAEWRQKARPYHNPGGETLVVTVEQFKSVCGEPSRTQTIQMEAYWYYECSDGLIQVVLADPKLFGGKVAITDINDY